MALLQQRGFVVVLVDPRKLKSVPGSKSDVAWRIAGGCSNCKPTGCWRRRFVRTTRRVCCEPTCGSAACSSSSPRNTSVTCRRR